MIKAYGNFVHCALSHRIDSIELVGDIVIRQGESLSLKAANNGTAIVVGKSQLRVDNGGRLSLVGLKLSDSIGSPAVHVEGELIATNCTFFSCRTRTNFVARYTKPALACSRPILPADLPCRCRATLPIVYRAMIGH